MQNVLVPSMKQVFCVLFKRGSQMGIRRLYQDIDAKHLSKYIEESLKQQGLNWWYTPPESPNLNHIELTWGPLKQFLRNLLKKFPLKQL